MDLSNENVIHVKKNGIEYLQFRRLLEYKDKIKHAYTLGINNDFRTLTPDKKELPKERYEKNINTYKKFFEEVNEDYTKIIKPAQDHTDEIKVVKNKRYNDRPEFETSDYSKTDGLITNKKDIILETTNADCILLLFYDPVKEVIANTHSGWKGTIQRISVKTVIKMKKEFGCNPEDIICCICPSIRKCHFEVDRDVKEMFENEYKDLKNDQLCDIIQEKIPNEKWNIDTVLINKIILQKAGLRRENIIDSEICSVCHSDLIHSFRVEKQGYGLNAAFIAIEK